MSKNQLCLDEQLCFPIYAASNLIVKAYRPFLTPLGLTYPQYLVMLVLWEKECVSVGDLGQILHLDSGTLTPLLKRMEQVDLIKRERSEVDQREVFIHLTDKSEMIRPELSNASEKVATASSLSKDEVKELNRLLGKVIDAFIETKEK